MRSTFSSKLRFESNVHNKTHYQTEIRFHVRFIKAYYANVHVFCENFYFDICNHFSIERNS